MICILKPLTVAQFFYHELPEHFSSVEVIKQYNTSRGKYPQGPSTDLLARTNRDHSKTDSSNARS